MTYERLLKADSEPGNWLTYSGSYRSWRYSTLDQINRQNAGSLKVAWVYQMPTSHRIEATPIVVDGVMYVSEPPSNVFALDAATGRPYWHYKRSLPAKINVCCDAVNRGVAVLGDRVFLGTVDAHLVALSAKTGAVLWDVPVADSQTGYSITGAPLIVKDMVITGIAGGEYGIRGFLDAYDVATGKRRWRFNTIPGPGEKGHETWGGTDAWKQGGGPTWVTGSYDPELNLVIWGVGNPSPDWNADVRPGDNLYSDSAIALDADTGKLKWHFQFVPHDANDWDAVQVPVLVDTEWQGRPRKLIYWAHRGGFYYVLDRATGEFLLGKPFAKQTWAKGLDAKGRPERLPNSVPREEGVYIWPGVQGATNWYSPSYNPLTALLPHRLGEQGLLPERRAEVHARQPLRGQRSGYRRPRRSGLRRNPRPQSQDRREGLGIQDAHQALVGSAHYRQPSPVRRQRRLAQPRPRRDGSIFFRAGCGQRKRAVAHQSGRHHGLQPNHLSWRTASRW